MIFSVRNSGLLLYSSKLPDEQAENNEFTAHLNTDSKHIHMWEMSELDAEVRISFNY